MTASRPKPSMANRPLFAVNMAKQAAKYLDGIGEAKRAEDVRALVRSNQGFSTEVQRLNRDIQQMRQRIAQMEGNHA